MSKVVRLLPILFLLTAVPAFACLNDTSIDRGEKEFRSQYDQPSKPMVQMQAGINLWSLAALSVGR